MAVVPPPEIDVVVVTAPRLPPLGGEAVFASRQLDASALKTAPRLDEALTREPGVSLFRRTGSDAANPTIQGISLRAIAPSGAGRALVTLNGAPVNDPFGGWVIWTALPAEGLRSATVVRGAGAGAYGAGALTGVIALEERPAAGGLAALDVSGAQRGGGRGAVVFGAPGLLVTATAQRSDGYIPVGGSMRGLADTRTALESRAASVRVQRELGGAQAALRLSGYYEAREAGLAGAHSQATGGSASLSLARVENGGGWRGQVWLNSSDLANTSVAVAAKRVGTTPANDQFSTPAVGYGVNGAWQGRRGPWSWELGADARIAQGSETERFRYLAGGFTRLREAGGRTAVGGVYAESVWDQGALLITAGARIDGWRQSGGVRRERDSATGVLTLNAPAADLSGTTPTARLGARWRISDSAWLRSAAYAGFRPATLNELHRPFRVGNDVTEANPSLSPETLYGAEIGVGGDGVARWSGTLFVNRLDDPITNVTLGVGPGTFPLAGLVPAGGAFRKRENAGRIDAWGVEGDVAHAFGGLELEAAFSATHARVDGGSVAPQLTGKRPAQTADLTITAGGHWRVNDHLTLSGQGRYESARFEDDLNTRKLAPSVGFDARAAWRVAGDGEVYLAVENLADSKIEVGKTADGVISLSAPRTLRIGFALRR